LAFDIPINKDVVRRILARHYGPERDGGGPSWLRNASTSFYSGAANLEVKLSDFKRY
jgi:hypothetical protein